MVGTTVASWSGSASLSNQQYKLESSDVSLSNLPSGESVLTCTMTSNSSFFGGPTWRIYAAEITIYYNRKN